MAAAAGATLPSCASGEAATDQGDTSSSSSGGGCDCQSPLVCDPNSGACVECVPGGSQCQAGEYCSETGTCESGCDGPEDCTSPQVCDTTTHQCADCVEDGACGSGFVCIEGACVAGCNSTLNCGMTEQCCEKQCVDTQNSLEHCGSCGSPCPDVANADVTCQQGQCTFVACDEGFADCNLDQADGCEQDLAKDGPCTCVPGEKKSCYEGPLGTENVGTCKAGEATCNASGTGWGECANQVTPVYDSCGDNLNQDCKNGNDDPPDNDGDGWGPCAGDCCDSVNDCTLPKLVNPGAFEVDGNNLDDDCDGNKDNVLATCDANLASNSATALDYAKAMDLCQATTENPPLLQKKWGVINATFHRADGANAPAVNSRSIRSGFGSAVVPFAGNRFTVLATGIAAAETSPNNTSPNWSFFQGGQDMLTSSAFPSDWLAANGNNLPNAPGCPDPASTTTAFDPVMLKLRVRVPTNAYSFNLATFFYSSEYPEFVCSAWNDFFLALLDSSFVPGPGETANPTDKNLAVYKSGNLTYPLGVNLAHGNTGLFKQCLNGSTGCGSGSVPGTVNTCVGTNQLTGTGFDKLNPPPQFPGDPGYCGTSNMVGGGTSWLTLTGNVKPGETIELRFIIWDSGDPWYDSLVLLDNFQWSVNAAEPGVHN